VVNIQKFADEARVSEVSFDYDLDVQRVYFIDEAHRDYKNGGAFLTNLVTSDRDAVKLALTGTPLVGTKKNNDTKKVFGPYIHTYFYNQSIADGYTLRLLREDVQTSFRVKMQEVMRDLREIDKLVKTEDVFKHPKYVVPLSNISWMTTSSRR
jgi:type I restriction enzyme, R subunit